MHAEVISRETPTDKSSSSIIIEENESFNLKATWDLVLMVNGMCMIRSRSNNCYLTVRESLSVRSTSLVPKAGSLFELVSSSQDFSALQVSAQECLKKCSFEGALKAVMNVQNSDGIDSNVEFESFDSMKKKIYKIPMRLSDNSRQARLIRLAIARMRKESGAECCVGLLDGDKTNFMRSQEKF